ncbi:MAG: coproporphyrinogen III oxidase family protein [Elusimicrobia bacterium]|nr:coproporphyrinogen III oxidase family protein [Elusimicrobiota bacterium]
MRFRRLPGSAGGNLPLFGIPVQGDRPARGRKSPVPGHPLRRGGDAFAVVRGGNRASAGRGGPPFFKNPEFESSLECNPETLTVEKLEALRRAGVNRLSLGLQTTEDPLLKALGRSHDLRTFHGAYRAARDVGFGNLNIDLMYGLPGQTRTGWMDTVKRVIDLAPEHVSAYALTVQEETYFHRSGVVPDDDLQADMYEEAADALIAAGFGHYEISNFAKPGRECRHNLRYWRNQDCLGAGVSAARYDGRTRRTNTDNLSVYLLAMEGGQTPVVEETALTEAERLGEDLMLGLRLAEGVAPSAAAARLYGASWRRPWRRACCAKRGGAISPVEKAGGCRTRCS